jgi:uncharacterized protein
MSTYTTKVGTDNQYYFNFKNNNGNVLLTSEAYISTAARDNGIESVKTNLSDDNRYEHLISKNHKYYFNIKAGNGEVIARSTLFENEVEKSIAMSLIKRDGINALIVPE